MSNLGYLPARVRPLRRCLLGCLVRCYLGSGPQAAKAHLASVAPSAATKELFNEKWFWLRIVQCIGPLVLNATTREIALDVAVMTAGIVALDPPPPLVSSSEDESFDLLVAQLREHFDLD